MLAALLSGREASRQQVFLTTQAAGGMSHNQWEHWEECFGTGSTGSTGCGHREGGCKPLDNQTGVLMGGKLLSYKQEAIIS